MTYHKQRRNYREDTRITGNTRSIFQVFKKKSMFLRKKMLCVMMSGCFLVSYGKGRPKDVERFLS